MIHLPVAFASVPFAFSHTLQAAHAHAEPRCTPPANLVENPVGKTGPQGRHRPDGPPP